MRILATFLLLTMPALAAIPVDTSGVKPGPVRVQTTADTLSVTWTDGESKEWRADFSLDPARPLITAVSVGGRAVMERARPLYDVSTGKRRGGWDQFFDFPPSHPDGTRSFTGVFRAVSAKAWTTGDRVEVSFAGLRMGIFSGDVSYVFYPGSRLIEQKAIVSTSEPDTAFFYNAGIRITNPADDRPGGNMESEVSYFDTEGQYRTVPSDGPEHHPVAVRYRALAARLGGGSVAVFPPPHRYFMPRDFTTNMGYLWHAAWKGSVYLGIRQLPDDNSAYYPWMNAPPGTRQELSMFLLPGDGNPRQTLDAVLRYTHSDRFPAVPGYKTFAPHWHYAYTGQAVARGFDWTPPFRPVLKNMGIDAAMINDFHGDGHPETSAPLRLEELEQYYRACRAQSGQDLLIIPAEEANVHLGGHYSVVFPKPVYWYKNRTGGAPLTEQDPKYGTVYHTSNPHELMEVVRREGGYVYQAHPRTKGSMGFPDQIRDSEQFLDPRYFGTGWKAMNSDLSLPHLSARGFKMLDDMNNWGLRKFALGEVDVFQIDHTHELYSHMNANYVKLDRLPDFDHYGEVLDAVANGRFWVSTGEVLLPEVQVTAAGPDEIAVKARVEWTFPLRVAQIVWGDGTDTHWESVPLETTREFARGSFDWKTPAKGWKWARVAVWDVAGNGAFTQPVRASQPKTVAVDGWHNNEREPHYRWEAGYAGGFSQLGGMLEAMGNRLRTVKESLTAKSLAGIDALIVVDPDTPAEAANPQYFTAPEIAAVDEWVKQGGRLVLLGNDKGNAEFEHFNQLAARFGIRFVEGKHADANGNSKLKLKTASGGVFYAVDVAPLEVKNPAAKVLLAEGNTPLMVLVSHGKGAVFALGDPWLYNEYIGSSDNRRLGLDLFRTLLQE